MERLINRMLYLYTKSVIQRSIEMRGKLFKNYSKWQKFLIIFFLIMIFLQNVLSTYNKSIIYDEKRYIGVGKYLIHTDNYKYKALNHNPPLSYYLNSILLLPLEFPEKSYQSDDWYVNGSEMIFHSGYSPFLITFLARLPFILLSLIFSLVVLKFAEGLYGIKSAIFAMFLYTFNVTILSHSNLVLTDFVVSVFMFLTIFYFWKLMNEYNIKNLLLTGVFFGLAQISKITAIILVPCLLLLYFAETYKKGFFKKKNIKEFFKIFSAIFIVGFIVIWASYGFAFYPLKEAVPPQYAGKAYNFLNKSFSSEPAKKAGIYVFEKISVPFPSYFLSYGYLSSLAVEGRERYFFGKIIEKSVWYYQFVVFLLKTQISLIVLLALAVTYSMKTKSKKTVNELYLILPVLLLLFLLMFNKMTVAVSHIIPIYPFLIVFCSKLVNSKDKIVKALLVLAVIHYFISAIFAFPDYFSYFNELAGGSKNGYKYLGDGNIDNGQNLLQLKEFMEKRNIQKINLSYLGSVDPKEYGITYDFIASADFQPWVMDNKIYLKLSTTGEGCKKRTGWIAISVSNYQGVYLQNRSCFSWLKGYTPIERIANSIFVYNIKS